MKWLLQNDKPIFLNSSFHELFLQTLTSLWTGTYTQTQEAMLSKPQEKVSWPFFWYLFGFEILPVALHFMCSIKNFSTKKKTIIEKNAPLNKKNEMMCKNTFIAGLNLINKFTLWGKR